MLLKFARESTGYRDDGPPIPQHPHGPRGRRAVAIARHPLSLAVALLLVDAGVFVAACNLQRDPMSDDVSNSAVGAAAVDSATRCQECAETALSGAHSVRPGP
jgi:hypothetical protein